MTKYTPVFRAHNRLRNWLQSKIAAWKKAQPSEESQYYTDLGRRLARFIQIEVDDEHKSRRDGMPESIFDNVEWNTDDGWNSVRKSFENGIDHNGTVVEAVDALNWFDEVKTAYIALINAPEEPELTPKQRRDFIALNFEDAFRIKYELAALPKDCYLTIQ